FSHREWLVHIWLDRLWGMALFAVLFTVVSLVVRSILRIGTVATVEQTLSRLPRAAVLRHAAAVALLGASAIYSGRVIRSAGYGGWVLALVLMLFAPLVTALVAPRFVVWYGVAAASAIVLSLSVLLVQDFRTVPGAFPPGPAFLHESVPYGLGIWCFA